MPKSETGCKLEITLSPEQAMKLGRLARRANVPEASLAQALLIQAIDEIDIGAGDAAAILDRIPGSWDRIDRGLEDARAGRTISIDDL